MADPVSPHALAGPLVPVLPAFGDDERLDLTATVEHLDALIRAGIRSFWTTYGTSHFFSLTDAEIRELTWAVAEVTRGRATFIASTSYHWPIDAIVDFCRTAQGRGVDVVKVQVDWRLAPRESDVLERYRRIVAFTDVPLFAYALGSGTFGASLAVGGPSLDGFRQLLEIPAIVGMKNDAGDFYEQSGYLAAVREAGRPFEVVTGGSMESFLHGRPFGQRLYAVGLGVLAPDLALIFDRLVAAGRLDDAATLVRDVEQPVSAAFASVGHWAAMHEALRLQGRHRSARVRFPLHTIDGDAARVVAEALEQLERETAAAELGGAAPG